jgi:hypothetical protein
MMLTTLNTDVIVAASAAVIALAALGVSIWQGLLMRKHNRLSVTPHLRFDAILRSDVPIRIVLSNTGVGPAIITDNKVCIDGENPVVNDGETLWRAIRSSLKLDNHQIRMYIPDVGDMMKVGEEYTLLVFPDSASKPEEKQRLCEALERVEFRFKYSSIYGDVFERRGPTW